MSDNRPKILDRMALWPLLLPLLLFLPGITGFPFPDSQSVFSDLAISHYPNGIYLRRALQDFGVVPFWSNTILSGYPFAANPLSGLGYPPGWLALLFPLPLGFNLLAILHILWGGLGMYRLLRAEGLGHYPGLLGALAFEFMPKIFAHYGAGHLTLTYAVSWTPWLLSVASPTFPAAQTKKRFVALLWMPGVILALIFLADPRWAAFAGGAWIVYALAYSQINPSGFRARPVDGESSIRGKPPTISTFDLQPLISGFGYLFSQIVLALLLSAPLLIPLLEYTRLSTRSSLTLDEAFVLSLPPARLLGLVFPDWGGPHEWMLYPGGVILVLGFVAVLSKSFAYWKRFWFWLGLLTLVFALGSSIPLLPAIARLPGFSLLRVPSRALFLSGMAFSALAAHGMKMLMEDAPRLNRRAVNLGLAALALLVVVLSAGFGLLAGEFPENLAWGAAVIVGASLDVGIALRKRAHPKVWFAALLSLALLDWAVMDTSVLDFHPREQVLSDQTAVAEYLHRQEGIFRVYSPSYSLPQQMAAEYGLELADGVDPLQLEAYAEFMERATGVPRNGYGVTIPPFDAGDPKTDNAGFLPDPALLGLLNVRFVASEFDLRLDGLELREQFGQTRLYENLLVLPRAWVQPFGADPGKDFQEAQIVDRGPNRITATAEGPGLLVLSEMVYPGWQVTVDGASASIQQVAGILRAAPLEPGPHQVVFSFHPVSLYLGLAGFLLGIGFMASLAWVAAKKTSR